MDDVQFSVRSVPTISDNFSPLQVPIVKHNYISLGWSFIEFLRVRFLIIGLSILGILSCILFRNLHNLPFGQTIGLTFFDKLPQK